jgi:DNA-binding beta-propeller fold protein YncE
LPPLDPQAFRRFCRHAHALKPLSYNRHDRPVTSRLVYPKRISEEEVCMTSKSTNNKPLLAVAVLAACLGMTACGSDNDDDSTATRSEISLNETGRYVDANNGFDEGSAEILAYDADSRALFVVNAQAGRVDVLDVQDPSAPHRIDTINVSDQWADAGGINSVAVANGLLAVAVENDTGTQTGRVQIYNSADRSFRSQADVGNLPDNVTFSRDGAKVLVANEGEPNADYSVDPEGSVSIVDVTDPDNPTVTSVGFADFNTGGSRSAELPDQVRVFGNFGRTEVAVTAFTDVEPATLDVADATGIRASDWLTLASSEGDPLPYQVNSVAGNTVTLTTDFDGDSEVVGAGAAGLTVYLHDGQSSVAQDLEPEYIAVSPDNLKAWVTLQENNAVAVLDIESASVDQIVALGTKDHNVAGNGIDPSDRDGGAMIANWPLQGMYMPDTIAAVTINGQVYYLTANEGDAREYDAYVEELRFEDAPRAATGPLSSADFADETRLGRIATTLTADTDNDGAIDQPLVFGARSFSIWASDGSRVFDSGSDFETITADRLGADFNSDNDENDSGDSRSDAKGPEPEAIAVGEINGRTFAFIGLERVGGLMVYDISNPASPEFVQYTTNRDFSFDIGTRIDDGSEPAYLAGDLAPESIVFISAADSPTDKPLIAVGNEVSGTTTFYTIDVTQVPDE